MILEKIVLSTSPAFCRFLDEGFEEGCRLFGLAVVGIQGDEDAILFGETMGGFRQDDGSAGGVLVVETRGKLTGSGGELDDAVGL